jgi:hypothetical protein
MQKNAEQTKEEPTSKEIHEKQGDAMIDFMLILIFLISEVLIIYVMECLELQANIFNAVLKVIAEVWIRRV